MIRPGGVLHAPIFAISMALTGCASFEGMPKPVVDPKVLAQRAADLPEKEALKEVAGLSGDAAKRYRNQVMATYLAAIDGRYREFRIAISKDVKGGNVGLDVIALGLSGAGAIAKGAANELSAGAAVTTGVRTAINKELYFEKTLPALVGAMDTARLKIRTAIEVHLREPIEDYPLEQGFADLTVYDQAASFDGAILAISTTAGVEKSVAEKKYENLVVACDGPTTLTPIWAKIKAFLYDLAVGPKADDASKADLATIADLLGAEKAAAPIDQAKAAVRMFNSKICSAGDANSLIAAIKAKTGRDVQ